jgi:sulfite reductase (NADPH) hemoprotein beta-component
VAAVDDPGTLGRARLSFANESEIDEFAGTLARFERGELSADEWRAFRLVRGTYGQRQPEDAHMIRVKIPQGVLTAAQLTALGDVADRYSRGFGHITTRQNLQFHFVRLRDVESAMRRLAEAGLTTREACGNSVRNITACPYAGVSPAEAFDPTPYAEALTRYLLRHPLSASLPRKFKMAFEGCPEDHAKTAIHDIGWRARLVDGRRGFRVLVGGGTAIMCRSGSTLFDFAPAAEVLQIAEAVLRVFHHFGDYQHKQRNRMKFLIKSLGWERWRAEVDAALSAVKQEGTARLPFDAEDPPIELAPTWVRDKAPSLEDVATIASTARLTGPGLRPQVPDATHGGYARWRWTNVRRQRQDGYVVATITTPLGDLTGVQLRVLASLSRTFGDGTVRVSVHQNLIVRWVRAGELDSFYRYLSAAGLGLADADTVADVTSCPGAESCKLAVTQSRGLGRTIGEFLKSRPELIDLAPELDVKISGCPNGCGQHHIAGIGFQGSLRKVGDRAAPQYFVMVGGGTRGDGASFGRVVAKVPARRCVAALERLMRLYATEREPSESAEAYFQRVDVARIASLLSDLTALTPSTATPDDFVDLGESREFAPETLDGECSA